MIDVCAGVGGFAAAAVAMGIYPAMVVDHDADALRCYAANFRQWRTYCLVGEVSDRRWWHQAVSCTLAWLVAGTPCQPFSNGGAKMGIEDPRFRATVDTVLLILFLRPATVVLENVPEISTWGGGLVENWIAATLTGSGYEVRTRVIPLHPMLPQNRRRWFLTAGRGDLFSAEAWDTHWEHVGRCPAPTILSAQDVISPFTPALQRYLWGAAEKVMFDADAFKGQRHDRRMRLDQPLPTLTASYRTAHLKGWKPIYACGVGVGRHHVRWLTERECAAIQGFPRAFQFGQSPTDQFAAYHQLGNAVPPLAFVAMAALGCATYGADLRNVAAAWDRLVSAIRGTSELRITPPPQCSELEQLLFGTAWPMTMSA
jgi:DNA (cytosine-5)-methyltransferase 1